MPTKLFPVEQSNFDENKPNVQPLVPSDLCYHQPNNTIGQFNIPQYVNGPLCEYNNFNTFQITQWKNHTCIFSEMLYKGFSCRFLCALFSCVPPWQCVKRTPPCLYCSVHTYYTCMGSYNHGNPCALYT